MRGGEQEYDTRGFCLGLRCSGFLVGVYVFWFGFCCFVSPKDDGDIDSSSVFCA